MIGYVFMIGCDGMRGCVTGFPCYHRTVVMIGWVVMRECVGVRYKMV